MSDRMPDLPNAACRDSRLTTELCDTCWDRPECLAWGLEHEPRDVWGGHGATSRQRIRAEFGIVLQPVFVTASGYSSRGAAR